MNLKIKAALQVAGMLSAAVIASLATDTLIKRFSAEAVIMGLGACVMAFVVYQLYAIRLSHLEYQKETESRKNA